MVRINEENTCAILKLYKDGFSIENIENKIGISDCTISRVLKNHNVEIRHKTNIHRVNENYFKSIDTCEKAYWFGFIMADGYVRQYRNKRNTLSSRFQLRLKTTDRNHIEKFLLCVDSDYPITTIKQVSKNGVVTYGSDIQINNKAFCNNIIMNGCVQAKSLILEYPYHIFKLHPEIERDFIRGYFDGDGCVSFSNSTYKENKYHYICASIASASDKFILSLQETLSRNLIESGIHKTKLSVCKSLGIRSKSIINFYHYMYDDSTICLPRKRDRFEKYFEIRA